MHQNEGYARFVCQSLVLSVIMSVCMQEYPKVISRFHRKMMLLGLYQSEKNGYKNFWW